MENQKQKLCQKITYKNTEFDKEPSILLGIILKEDNDFVVFQTARREYRISKSCIICIENTNQEFREDSEKQ